MTARGSSTWDKDPVRCPHGHFRIECQRVRIITLKSGEEIHRFLCAIARRKQERARREGPSGERKRQTDREYYHRKYGGISDTPQKCSERRGNWMNGNRSIIHIRLVCLHTIDIERDAVPFDPYGMMYCRKCSRMKYIHEYTGYSPGDRSYLVYVPEIFREGPAPEGPPSLVAPEGPPLLVAAANNMATARGRAEVLGITITPSSGQPATPRRRVSGELTLQGKVL